ncbi:unnamed protein product, partial [Vitis vinifera]
MGLNMFRWDFLFVFLVIQMPVISTTPHLGSGPHIADVNILLPPKMTYPVEYLLQGSGGCFKWSWDHHDILSVLPEYNVSSQCSTSARLKSIATYNGRKETAVYAADIHTGIVVRCKVFIDNISRIQIFHNSIKLDLDGLATLRVRAFDSEENVFSSLVGLQFMWQLRPETDGLPPHLVHVPLKDSPLSDCGGLCGDLSVQIKLEDGGAFSDLYVVKGIGIGHEVVSVHLLEPQFEHMADKIVLTVAEAMSLDPPSPVFILIGAAVRYTLKVIRGNIPQVVALPSPYHRWSVLNSSVAQVDSQMGLVNVLSLGVTTVTVEDTRVAGHIQMSSLHVVLPDTLCLYILPLSLSDDPLEGAKSIPSGARWYAFSGQQYLIQMKVFSGGPGGQEVYITESDEVSLQYNQSIYWKAFLVSDRIAVKHDWWNSRILKMTSEGLGNLTASLSYFSGQPGRKEVLKVVQEVMVCEKVKFSFDKRSAVSERILLPWAPAVYQEVDLKATGGCAKSSSDYKWFSSDMATVSVSASGVIQAKKPGKAAVKVVSIFDPFNYDEVVVEVALPSSMVMLQNFPVETVVGSQLQAAVTMKASNGAYFYRCDAFSSFVRWKAGSESFIIVNATGETPVLDKLESVEPYASVYGPPCAWTYVYASSAGRAMLHATLTKEYQHHDHPFHGPIVLQASSRIGAYLPLVLRQAGDGNQFGGYWINTAQAEAHSQFENLDDLFLVPGTHLDVMLVGGPEWWDKSVDFNETVDILDEHARLKDGVLVHEVSSSYGSLYRVLCQILGTYKIAFKRGNLVGDDHPLPAVAEVELSLTCSFPSSITLIADEPVNEPGVIWAATQADRNPERIRVTPITVANGRTIRIAAVGISNSGKAFANSSSLCLKWELSNCDALAFWDDSYDLGGSSSGWERFLILQNESRLCIVRATVIGFAGTVSGHVSAPLLESSENVLTDAVRLQLVSSLRVTPEFKLLFFNSDAKANLSITGGSCFLDAVVNDSRVVDVIQPPPGLQCLQLIVAPKGLGTALVTVYDIGLAPHLSASSVVQVADVDWIRITSGEEISLMEGSVQSIIVMAGVDDGSTFDASQYVYMNIQVHIEDHIVDLVDDDNDISSIGGGYVNSPKFMILAKHLGVTILYVSARQASGYEIASNQIKVEVYAPPRIHPPDIFLVPGAAYVLNVKGGPQIGVVIEYASLDDRIATVNKSSGRLSAISPGNSTLVATVYGKGDTVICQAYGRIKVGVPSLVTLNVQSEQLDVGREMPIFPSLPQGDLFSFYELCKNYKWTVEDEKVLSFHMAEHIRGDRYGLPSSGSKEIKLPGHLDEKDLGFINMLYGRSAGRTTVAVSFNCDFISSGHSQSRSYSASMSISVVSELPLAFGVPITWVLPPYYTTSSLLPSSSESYGQWDLSRKGTITYSLLRSCGGKNEEVQKDAISIDRDRIKTTESNNLACIQAKDRTTGKTGIASCVRVAEVAQIRITPQKFSFHVIDLAVDAEVKLPINFCDVLGNPFHEAFNVIPLDAETNYPDIVSINSTGDGYGNIHLKGIRHGRALLRVSINSSPHKSDYVLVSVGAYLSPRNPVLHLGGHLNFSIEGLKDKVSGQWLSGNESVISLDVLSGEAQAVGEGTTQVFFECSSLKLQTTVTVQKGKIVLVDAPMETLTNAPIPAKGYNFSVKFSSDTYGHDLEGFRNDMGVLFDCRVDPPFVGYAKPWRDFGTGKSYCLFFPYSPEHLARSVPKSKDMRPYISLSISASVQETNHVSGSASALFVGGFSILEMGKLNLTAGSNKTIITILGNTDVDIHWHERDSIMISPVHKEDFGIGGLAKYEVKVLQAKKFKDKVVITLPANGQRVELDVSYDPGERAYSVSTVKVTLWAGVVGCIALLLLTLAIFIFFLDRPDRARPSNPPANSSIVAPTTPDRRSPAVQNDSSPRTPQPFVEYVRRTIHETPYYTREGRRRVNPQNTY